MHTEHFMQRMSTPAGPRLYKGHDPSVDVEGYPGQGVDMLLTEFLDDDGKVTRRELATRPGHRQTWLTWGVPVVMEATL